MATGLEDFSLKRCLSSPKLLELLIRLFDASAIYSEVVIRRPQLIEDITRGTTLGLSLSKEQFLQDLQRSDENLPPTGMGSRLPEKCGRPYPFARYPRDSPPRKICSSK